MRVFVLNMRGEPLMPCSPAKARILLKEKKARVKKRTPFVIELTMATGEAKQEVTLGVDAGYKHAGFSASSANAELYASEAELRQDITDLLATRHSLRRARRSRNTPRFNNRVRRKRQGWLAPSVENRIAAHISRVDAVCLLLPVSKIVVETAAFDTQLLKNPEITGEQYQQGEPLGFWNVREYVLARDGHVCQHCRGKSKDPVLNVHHLESRRTGGDSPGNLITLCETCHKAYHRGEIQLNAKRGQSFRAEAFMGIMRPTLLKRLRAKHPDIEVQNTYGYLTKHARITHGIPKTHAADAFCIAGNLQAKRLDDYFFEKQTRRNNRQIHKLKILQGGIRKRNQAPYEIKGFRLFDKIAFNGEEAFIFGRRSSGYFDLRRLDGTRISACASCKKLRLLERRKTFLIELRKESALLP